MKKYQSDYGIKTDSRKEGIRIRNSDPIFKTACVHLSQVDKRGRGKGM